jgi:uncharacterized integral membrane protein
MTSPEDSSTPEPRRPRPDPSEARAEARRTYRGTGLSIGAVVGVVVLLALIVFVAQNTASTRMHWLGFDFAWPLAAALLAAMAAGVVVAGSAGWLWRHRRRRRLREREELHRLRTGAV